MWKACFWAWVAIVATLVGCGASGGSGGFVPTEAGVEDDASTGPGVDAGAGQFAVKVTVGGRTGAGLVLQNNGGDDLLISGNGDFTFKKTLADGAGYEVKVLTQPKGPTQECAVTAGQGRILGKDAAVVVTCSTKRFTIGGTVAGLTGSGLVLQNNGGDNLAVSANGTFTFATPIESGKPFEVTVLTQPSQPTQTCVVTGEKGTVTAGNVSSVTVNLLFRQVCPVA